MEKRKIILLDLINQKFESGAYALDLGCGTGKFSFMMAKNGLHVVAVDINKNFIKEIDETKGELNIDTVCEDISSFFIEKRKYRVIFARNSLSFVNEKQKIQEIVKNAVGGLVVGGQFFFTLFGNQDPWSSNKKMIFFDRVEVDQIIKDLGLVIVSYDEYVGDGPTMDGENKLWHIFTVCLKNETI